MFFSVGELLLFFHGYLASILKILLVFCVDASLFDRFLLHINLNILDHSHHCQHTSLDQILSSVNQTIYDSTYPNWAIYLLILSFSSTFIFLLRLYAHFPLYLHSFPSWSMPVFTIFFFSFLSTLILKSLANTYVCLFLFLCLIFIVVISTDASPIVVHFKQ